RPFDLHDGPLFRTRLLLLGPDDQIFLFAMHHIITDGPSVAVMVRELGLIYLAYCHGLPSPLPELPAQYVNYVRWERENLEGGRFENQLAYWQEHLAHAPRALELPTDRPRPRVTSFRGARERVRIPSSLTSAVRRLGERHQATRFVVFLAG